MDRVELIQNESDIYLELSSDMLCRINKAGEILSCRKGKKYHGIDIFSGSLLSYFDKSDTAILNEAIRDAVENQKTISLQLTSHFNGESQGINIQITGFNEKEAVAILSSSTRTGLNFKRFEHVLRSLAGNIPNAAVMLFDRELRYRLAEGQALSRIAPEEKDSLVGKSIYEAVKQPLIEVIADAFKKALAGQNSVFEIQSQKDYWYQAIVTPFYDEEEIAGGMVLFLDITEHKVNEERLKNNSYEIKNRENIYRALAKNIPNATLTMFDKDLRYTFFEGPAIPKLGYSKETLLGHTPTEVFPEEVCNYLIPAYKDALLGKTTTFETKGISSGHNYLITITPSVDDANNITGGLVTAFDIDHLRNTESELQAKLKELEYSRSIYRALANNLPNGAVILFDEKMDHILAAGKAINLSGVEFTDIEGKNLEEFDIEPSKKDFLRTIYKKALAGETISYEYQLNNHKWVYLTVLPFMLEGRTERGGMIVAYDINQQKETESLLEEHLKNLASVNEKLKKEIDRRHSIERDLQEYAAELRGKNEELEQFAYVASHDLQEPLRMVSSFTQLLSNKYGPVLDTNAHEYINFAVEGAKRMQNLINGLLEYSRAGRKQQPFEPVDLNEVIEAAKHNLGFRIEDTRAQIFYEKMPVISGNFVQLVQLFQNLIGNALKFRVENIIPEIRISASKDKSDWLIKIKDNGIGFSNDHSEKIFLIFQRLHTRDKYEGTGIGLAMCRKIAELHGGRIWAEPDTRQGAIFYIKVPAAKK